MQDDRRLTVRLPGPVADWLFAEKQKEGSTINFEIIRAVRERMVRETKTAPTGVAAPAGASPEA